MLDKKFDLLRDLICRPREFAKEIKDETPYKREIALVITKLDEARLWCDEIERIATRFSEEKE